MHTLWFVSLYDLYVPWNEQMKCFMMKKVTQAIALRGCCALYSSTTRYDIRIITKESYSAVSTCEIIKLKVQKSQ